MMNGEMNDPLFDPAAPFGPIELNLLERVEMGMNASDDRNIPSHKDLETPQNEHDKYEGPKEVMFVTGWVNINSVYERYKWAFIAKIGIGILIIISLLAVKQNFWPIAAAFCFINFVHVIKNVYFLHQYRDSSFKIKLVFWVELHFSLGYFIFFLGFLLLMLGYITTKFFLLYSLPYLGLTVFLFFASSDDNLFLSQKKFSFIEGIQLVLIAMKFGQIITISWNYVLILFMAAAIYLTVLGLLMSIILSCSVFGFLYRELEPWKVKSLVWMTWYYLTTGLIFIYLIKGVVHFYGEEDLFAIPVSSYLAYQSNQYQILYVAAVMMIVFSMVNLIFHLVWKEDIKRFLTKVIYKNELRKEISLRFLTKSFTFKLIQISTTYFMRPDNKGGNGEPEKQAVDQPRIDEKEPCLFCYDAMPNIMLDPCNHGGVCKTCITTYLKGNEGKCPFCKDKIKRLFLIEYNEAEKQYYAKGEIKFRA